VRFTYPDIAERIQRLTGFGNWTFTYLGANQELSQVSEGLGIARSNVTVYSASPEGTKQAWTMHERATQSFIEASSLGNTPAPFYSDEG
jgi:hypothetical protein